jgi:hypothetical protein
MIHPGYLSYVQPYLIREWNTKIAQPYLIREWNTKIVQPYLIRVEHENCATLSSYKRVEHGNCAPVSCKRVEHLIKENGQWSVMNIHVA